MLLYFFFFCSRRLWGNCADIHQTSPRHQVA